MGAEIRADKANELIDNSPDRIYNFSIGDRVVPTHLAKNPESWRQALRDISSDQVILSVNARGIDGLDTSWLWDIDYSDLLGKRVTCTGERRLDVAYRLSVQGIETKAADTFRAAVDSFPTGPIQAIASYTAYQDLLTAEFGTSSGKGDLV